MKPRVHIKLVLGALVASALTVPVVAIAWTRSNEDLFLQRSLTAVDSTRAAFDLMVGAEKGKLGAALDIAMRDPEIVELFLAGDRQALLDAVEPTFEKVRVRDGITHWYFISADESPTVMLRVHNPYKHGDVVDRSSLRVATGLDGRASGLDLGRTAFALRVVSPWRDRDGRRIGYMEMAQEIDGVLGSLAEVDGDELGLVLPKERLDRDYWSDLRRGAGLPDNWEQHPRNVSWYATDDDASLTHFDDPLDQLPEEGAALEMVSSQDRHYARRVYPLRDVEGRTVAAFVVAADVTALRSGLTASVRQVAWVTALFAVVMTLIVVTLVELLVLQPIARASRAS